MAEERLQKILAQAGIASRRKAEELIEAGRVRVDGRIVTELGSKADPRAKIEVDGRRIQRDQLCYGILHKPRHMVTTLSDPEGRPMAKDLLDQVGVRVVPIGRLDFNTSGALLFTNDGDFAQGLSHASGNVPKVYVAKLQGRPTEQQVERWRESIDVEGKRTRPAEVRILRQEDDKCWIEVTISEGRNRQVRRLGEHANTPVVRLSRLSHAGITTEGLRPGEWRLLTVDELKELKKKYGVPKKIRGVMEEDDERRPMRSQRPARFTADSSRARPKRANEKSEGRGPSERAAEKRKASGRGAAESAPAERGAPKFERTRERSPAARGLWSDFEDVASENESKRGRGVRAVGAERASARGGEGRGTSGPSRGPSARSSSGPSRGPSARSSSGPSRGPSARSGSFERGPSARSGSGPSRGPSARSGSFERGPSARSGESRDAAPRGRGPARPEGERSYGRSSESRGRPAEARGRSSGRPGASQDRPVTRGRPSTRGGAGGARAEGPTRGRAEPSNRSRSQGVKPESRGSKSAHRPKKRS